MEVESESEAVEGGVLDALAYIDKEYDNNSEVVDALIESEGKSMPQRDYLARFPPVPELFKVRAAY